MFSDGTTRISQTVNVKGGERTLECFTLSVWAKADIPADTSENSTSASKAYIGARLIYASDSKELVCDLASNVRDWQNVTLYIEKDRAETLEGIEIFAVCENVPSDVYFDSISLVRDSIELNVSDDYFTENDTDGGNTFVCSHCGATCDCGNMSSEEGLCIVCYNNGAAEADSFSENKDDWGNNLTETTFGDEASLGAIYRSFTYTDDKNNLKTVRDERGNVTVYDVQNSSSRVLSETDPIGNKKEYEYDVHGRTSKVTHKDNLDTELAAVEYEYDAFDNLTEINRGDRNYSLEYNYMHQLDSISADNLTSPLVSYGYTHGGRPKTVTYANGDVMTAVYNAKGQIISEIWENGIKTVASYKYTYDTEDNIIKSLDTENGIEYNYTYDDGVIVRATVVSGTYSDGVFKSKATRTTIIYKYNGSTLVKKRIINHEDGAEQVYTYTTGENGESVSSISGNFGSANVTSVTDGFGRAVSESIATGIGTISRSFTYTEGDSEPVDPPLDTNEYKPTTQLVKTIELSDGTVLDYEYDACGRITKVTETRNGTATVTEYTYDALGQLTSETVNGTVVNAMTYDSYGNILTKNGVSYSYDSTWKDRLVSVGNKTITYGTDPCNPATYFGNALVWEKGRQLKQFGNYTYKYNANGIRTDKWENGVQHVYTLDGAKILREELVVGETNGNSVIVPIYNTNGSVIGITRSDTTSQYTYYFLKNLQGDIIAITDETGEVVARYNYDAWGACIITSDTSGASIATVNPFRYRGYYYDTETGLYYLQSRYYDPAVGRFLNSDEASILLLQGNVLYQNAFVYCNNNSVNLVDNIGYISAEVAAGAFVSTYGMSYAGVAGGALVSELIAFLTAIAPYLLIILAVILALLIIYFVIKGVSQGHTRRLSDTKAKKQTGKQYRVAYISEFGGMCKVGRKMDFVQALIALGVTGATNDIVKRYVYNREKSSSAQREVEHKGSGNWGIYADSQSAAKALAVVFGYSESPEVHASGMYGHYHDSTHTFHIWYGGKISY